MNTSSLSAWRSPDAMHNMVALRQNHPGAFTALGEVDALGHRILSRVSGENVHSLDQLVGLSFIRRSVTLIIGTRTLLEAAAVEPAKLTLRAQFELMLATRYLIHGGRRDVDLVTPTSQRMREIRARYFAASTLRAKVYRRQALLDRAWDPQTVDRPSRRRLKQEIADHITRLETLFPVQHRRFGPFRCHGSRKRKLYFDANEWFSFGFRRDNVNSVRALARRFGYLKFYEILYSAMSALTHPRSYEQDLRIENGQAEIFSPYLADAFDTVCFYGISYAMLTLIWLAKAYSPSSIADAQSVSINIRALTASLSAELPDGFLE